MNRDPGFGRVGSHVPAATRAGAHESCKTGTHKLGFKTENEIKRYRGFHMHIPKCCGRRARIPDETWPLEASIRESRDWLLHARCCMGIAQQAFPSSLHLCERNAGPFLLDLTSDGSSVALWHRLRCVDGSSCSPFGLLLLLDLLQPRFAHAKQRQQRQGQSRARLQSKSLNAALFTPG